MTLPTLPIPKDSQVMKLCLSFAAVIVAIPLVLSAKVPAQTSLSGSSESKPAGDTAAPQVPPPINLRPLAARSNSSANDALQAKLDAEQAARDAAQDASDRKSEALAAQQEAQTATAEAASSDIATPTTPTPPVGGRGGGETSPLPTPTTPVPAPAPETPVTTPPPSGTGTTPPTGSDTTRKDTRLPRVRTQVPSPLRRLL